MMLCALMTPRRDDCMEREDVVALLTSRIVCGLCIDSRFMLLPNVYILPFSSLCCRRYIIIFAVHKCSCGYQFFFLSVV